ncbi:TM2 domain-containing protein [Vibrio owensii]|uniref:TM2 domain-containing protein n=1 Tax=Vibrio owensii TaxID=696485 RepID=UPI0018F22ABC|nr:TM2 domain-containing protein [Vibrio owensii]
MPYRRSDEYYNEVVYFLLGALCLVGLSGLHRIYTKRYVSGVLFLLTMGFFFLGNVWDFLKAKSQLAEANLAAQDEFNQYRH